MICFLALIYSLFATHGSGGEWNVSSYIEGLCLQHNWTGDFFFRKYGWTHYEFLKSQNSRLESAFIDGLNCYLEVVVERR